MNIRPRTEEHYSTTRGVLTTGSAFLRSRDCRAGTDAIWAAAQAPAPGTAEKASCSMLPNSSGTIAVDASDLCPADRTVRDQLSANGMDVVPADIFGLFSGKTTSATVEMHREAECS